MLTLIVLSTVVAMAQNSIDRLVERVSGVDNKFTSAVERDPKTGGVVKVVKMIERNGYTNIRPYISAFKKEKQTGNFTEKRDDESLMLMLVVSSAKQNRIYMFTAKMNRHVSDWAYSMKLTVIVRNK